MVAALRERLKSFLINKAAQQLPLKIILRLLATLHNTSKRCPDKVAALYLIKKQGKFINNRPNLWLIHKKNIYLLRI